MSTINKIKFSAIEKNDAFKVLVAKGKKGDQMPLHLSDKAAFLMVQRGEILFQLNEEKSRLSKGQSISIPPDVVHSFEVLEDCETMLIMDANAKIKYVK